MFGFQLCRTAVRPVTLETGAVDIFRPQQVRVLAAVRLVAGSAALLEGRLMAVLLLVLLGLVRVTAEAGVDRIGLHESRRLAGVRSVAVGALARRPRMLHLRVGNLLDGVVVAGDAQVLRAARSQDHLAVFRRLVAGLAHLVFERIVRERLQQLGRSRLVRVVALNAVGRRKRLILVRLLQVRVFRIVAVEAQRRGRLRQVEVKFFFAPLAGPVGHMAGFAAHVQSGVPAALLRYVEAGLVATEAQILLGVSRTGLQQLVLVVGDVRIMALDAIPYRRAVHNTFDFGGVLVGMASKAESVRRRGDELYPGDVFVRANLMTAQTAHRDRRVDRLALGFILMTLEALFRISVRVERDGMGRGPRRSPTEEYNRTEPQQRRVAAVPGPRSQLASLGHHGHLWNPPIGACARP